MAYFFLMLFAFLSASSDGCYCSCCKGNGCLPDYVGDIDCDSCSDEQCREQFPAECPKTTKPGVVSSDCSSDDGPDFCLGGEDCSCYMFDGQIGGVCSSIVLLCLLVIAIPVLCCCCCCSACCASCPCNRHHKKAHVHPGAPHTYAVLPSVVQNPPPHFTQYPNTTTPIAHQPPLAQPCYVPPVNTMPTYYAPAPVASPVSGPPAYTPPSPPLQSCGQCGFKLGPLNQFCGGCGSSVK